MAEMVRITEHGQKFHRDQPHGDGTVCGSGNGKRPRRVTRLQVQHMGYAPCSTCHHGVKELGEYTLYQEDTSRWTDADVRWSCYTAKSVVLCPVCDELIEGGDILYFCILDKKPLHEDCRSECRANPNPGQKHLHRRAVLIDQQARQDRWRQLQQSAPGGPGDGDDTDTDRADERRDERTAALVKAAVHGNETKRRVLQAVS